MVQFSFSSNHLKHTFSSAVAQVVSATKSKMYTPIIPGEEPNPQEQLTLYATFSVYASAAAKDNGGQAIESISKNYTCLEDDEPFAKSESSLADETSGTII